MTGASGFLGRHVLQVLHAEGIPAVALVRDRASWDAMSWTRPLTTVTPLVGSVTGPTTWAQAPEVAELGAVLHLGALVRHARQGAEEVYRTNVDGTLTLVRTAAERSCRIVFVSTSGTVGCFREPGMRADEDAPYCTAEVVRWPYYHSKVLAEQRARETATTLGASLVIVRPPVLLGPGDHRYRSTGNLVRFLRGRLPFVVRGGIHYSDVRDAAPALVRAASIEAPRPVYHLTGTMCGIEEFFALAAELAGMRAPRFVLPPRFAWWLATITRPLHLLPDPVVIELASHFWGTTSRWAEAELGYSSRSGRETLADTIAWLRAHHPGLRQAR